MFCLFMYATYTLPQQQLHVNRYTPQIPWEGSRLTWMAEQSGDFG